MASTARTSVTISMETGLPNSGDVTIRTGPESADDLRRAFGEVGLSTADALELSVPNVLTAVFQVQNVLGSAGPAALAKGLSTWLHRNDGKEINERSRGRADRARAADGAGRPVAQPVP
jgi:hypothetical protein